MVHFLSCISPVADEHPRHNLIRIHPRELSAVRGLLEGVARPDHQHAEDVLGQPSRVILNTQHVNTGR